VPLLVERAPSRPGAGGGSVWEVSHRDGGQGRGDRCWRAVMLLTVSVRADIPLDTLLAKMQPTFPNVPSLDVRHV
jgi:hypothetical protein